MMDNEDKTLVNCPVCKGVGHIYPQKPGGCLCCNGTGRITAEKDIALATIRKDLARRLQLKDA